MSKKARTKAAAGTPAPASTSTPTPAEAPAKAYHFWFLPDADPVPVDENALHGLMKTWRHGRATRSLWDAIQDAYVAVFSIVMIGAMIVNAVLKAQSTSASCSANSCVAARTLLPWATVAGVAAFSLVVSRMFGPVTASAAEGFWLMDAPISRYRLLRSRLVLALAAVFGLGALTGGLVAALTGSDAAGLVGWSLAGATLSAGLTAFAAVAQRSERTRLVSVVQALLGLLAVAVLLVVVGTASGWINITFAASVNDILAWALAGIGLILLIGSGTLAFRGLNGIRRARLLSGGSLVSGMQGAMYALDFGLIRDILMDRAAREKGFVKAEKGRGTGVAALVWRDWQRIRRSPKPFIGLAVSLVTPYAFDSLGWGILSPLISGLGLVIALVPFMTTLRVLSRTKGLVRLFPFTNAQLRSAAMVVPGVLAALWTMAATPALAGITSGGTNDWANAALVSTAVGFAGFLGAVRWVTAKQVDFGVPMMATGAGAMPPSLMFNLFRGFDMVALVTAPIMLGFGPIWGIGIGLVAFFFLRSPLNSDELREQQEQAKKELAANKAEKERVRIARPGR